MEVADGIIALAIGYFAFKGFRAVKERVFLYIHFSFTLLGVGFLAHGLTTGVASARPVRFAIPLLNFGYLVYFIAELIAYSLLISAYLQQTKSLASSLSSSALPFLIAYNPVSEVVIFCLTAFITAQCAVNYSVKRKGAPLLVLIGFALITLSHVLFPLAGAVKALFLAAHTLQLIGFVLLLAMVLKVSKG
ncbi:TPA: hypothetical protein EYP26_00695 [Candidatus Bathyarchaeota archaeon]|nr:hypothetical protein [Candidatus Bathyarchaeota archaeon]